MNTLVIHIYQDDDHYTVRGIPQNQEFTATEERIFPKSLFDWEDCVDEVKEDAQQFFNLHDVEEREHYTMRDFLDATGELEKQ